MKPYIHKECLGVRGIKFFKCLKCGKESSNYSNGINICHECCIKDNICQVCGKELKDNTIKDSKKNIEQKAHDNYNTWKEWWDKADIASKQAGITLEQGISFLDNLYKNHNK